jgi:hypothetical protein
MSDEQNEVTVEGMQSALDDLVKAADATDVVSRLQKGSGNNIEHSGHVDERGKVGGGRADYADAGGLDDMMVGKLAEAGIPADMIAAFSEFVGKASDEDEEEEDEEEENGKMGFKGYKKSDDDDDFRKSAMEQLREDTDISDAVDVSPYLEAMTARTADMIDGLRKSQDSTTQQATGVYRAQAAAMYQIGSLLKSQSAVIDVLSERLGIVERTPNAPKGATTSAVALQKSMPGEADGNGQLLKSELLSTLNYMNLEKGIKNIGGQKTYEIVGMYEGGGALDPSALEAAHDFLAANPKEAQAARSYT